MSVLPRGSTVRRDAGLYGYERALRRHGIAPVAGVDEAVIHGFVQCHDPVTQDGP